MSVKETKFLTTADSDLEIAADIIKMGGNVILPTETVYGLGGDALNPNAVVNIFKAKGRPGDNPLILHISDINMLSEIASEVPEKAKMLMDKFWPGPLTIIFKKCKNVPYETTGGLETAAVRMPDNKVARRLIELSETPIAAPSANLSGKPSPTTFKHCKEDMDGRVDAIIDGGDCKIGVESTVIDLSGDVPIILRPGEITKEQITDVIGETQVVTSVKSGEAPKSPGLKYKHYAPKAEVYILSGTAKQAKMFVEAQSKKENCGVLVFDEFPKFNNVKTISLGSIENPKDAMHRLFTAMRRMDEMGVDVIYAPEISDNGMWSAVKNRLYRGAANRVIDLSMAEKKEFKSDFNTDSNTNSNTESINKKVLFVCTGNTCRSPMAEQIFNTECKKSGISAMADSAGLFADGSPASKNSVAVMDECGCDINGRKSKQLTGDMIQDADMIICMTSSHKQMIQSAFSAVPNLKEKALKDVYTFSDLLNTSAEVPDPYGGDIQVYRFCRDTLKEYICKLIESDMLKK